MPNFFDFYRERTGDARDDDSIALDFIREHPEAIDKIPELKAKADALHKYAQEQFPVTAKDVAKNVYGSAVRSFAGGLADIPEAVSVLNAEVDRKTGFPVNAYLNKFLLDPAAQGLRATGEAITPEPDPRLEDSFWATKVPGYIGSAGSFLATGAAGKVLGIGAEVGSVGLKAWVAENAVIGLAGAASQAVGAYKEALAKGADRDMALNAYLLNLPIGATEVVPLSRMLKRLDGITGHTFTKALIEAGKESFEEATQEAVQQFASNYVAKKLYDKDRNLLQDLQENAAGGGITGFLFSALTQAIGGALGKHGHAPRSSGDSTPPTLPPPVIPGVKPPAAGPPNAPAGPAASPIATGMEPLTGTLNDDDRLDLKTWAQQDVAGTLGAAETARRDSIFQRNPQLASAYSIYREQAAQVASEGKATSPEAIAPMPEPPPPSLPPAPDVPPPTPAPEPQPVNREDLHAIALSVLQRVNGIPNPNPQQQQTGRTLYAMLSNPSGPDYDNIAAMLNLRLDENASLVPPQFAGNVGTQDTGERFVRPSDVPPVPPGAPLRPEPQPNMQMTTPVISDTGATRLPRIPQSNPTAWEIRNRALRQAAGQQVEEVAPVAPEPAPAAPVAAVQTVTEAVPPAALPVPPAAAAVDPFSRINEQDPGHVSLEGMGINQMEAATTKGATVYSPVLDAKTGERVKNKAEKGSITQRITFFEDTKTGEVFGVGTYENTDTSAGNIRTAYVGKTPMGGMTLRKLLMGGTTGPRGSTKVPAGRFKALDTYRADPNNPIHAADHSHTIRYANRAEYEAKWKAPAITLMDRNAAYEGGEGVVEPTGAYTGAPREVTKVDAAATPDEVAAAKEGFTQDEAKAIFKVTKGAPLNHRTSEVANATTLSMIIRNNPDATAAVLKMFAALDRSGAHAEMSGDERAERLAHVILQWIYDARTKGKGNEKAFAHALTEAVSKGIPTGPDGDGGGGAAASSTASSVGGTSGSAGAAGTDAGTVGGGGQGTPSSLVSETDEVRLHTAPAGLPPGQVSDAYRATLFSAAQQGLDVTVIQQGIDAVASEVSGVYGQQAGRPMAVVTVNDLSNPSIESLYVLTAEVAHHVFAGLPTAEQARLQSAVRAVTDGLLGITGENLSVSEAIPAEQQDAVMQEERLVDATVRSLVSEGFNPAEAQGVAQALWRAIKDLFLRVARVLHDTWMGVTGQESGEAGARMAQAYFENRVRSWLAGDARLSFVDFMGGGSTTSLPMIARRGTWFTPANGAGMAWRWNPETFQFDVAEPSIDSVAAAQASMEMPSIRYHRPSRRNAPAPLSPDRGPEIRIPDFAALNELQAVLASQFAEFNAQGHNLTSTGHPAMTLDQFIAYVLPASMDSPAEVKTAMTAEMQQKIGATVPNPDVRLATLNEATKVETANKAVIHLNKIRSSWDQREKEASHALSSEPGSTQSKFDKQAIRTINLVNNYTDAAFLFSEMKQNVDGWMVWLRDGLRKGFREGRDAGQQVGVLEQLIKQLEGRVDGKIGKQYVDAINKLAAGFQTEEHRTRFVVMMQKVAALPVWLGESSLQQVRDIIRDNSDPALASLQQDTPESRALLAIAGAFAKDNALMLHMLALRGEVMTSELLEERAKLNAYLKQATSDNAAVIANARRDVKKLVKLGVRGEAILDALDAAKKKQATLHDELMAARRFTEFYRTNERLLAQQSANMEAVIGAARKAFEPYDGAEFNAPENSTQAPKDWPKIIFSHTRDGNQQAEIEGAQRRLDDWMEANPTPGADYNYAEAVLNKLKDNAIEGKHNEHVRRVSQAVLGPITVKLEQTGIPSLMNAARRVRHYLTLSEQNQRPAAAKAVNFSKAENAAMKAMGYRTRQLENFRRLTDRAWFYFGQRKDLLYGAPTDSAGRDRRLNATLNFLHLTGDKRRAMETFMREWGDQSFHYTEVSEKMGNKVDDDALGMLRSARGAWGEVMRMMSGGLDVVFTDMMGRAKAPGPWANDPFKGRDLAEEYNDDPDALRQSLAPLFSPPNVWRNFVAPIANRPGTAMFNGPEDSSGYAEPASTEDVKRAFAATQPGDIVGFAERLFDVMEGDTVTGADRAIFVAQTVGVFSGVFNEVKTQKQESSAATGVNIENVTQLLMNARRGENWPPEFVSYRPYDLKNSRSLVNHLAFHAAFGRNMDGINREFHAGTAELQTMHNRLAALTDEAFKETPGATPAKIREAVEKKAAAAGYKLSELTLASASLASVKDEQRKLQAFVGSQGGTALEFRALAEVMGASVAAVVQGPATHLLDTISLFKPIQLWGVSTQGLKHTAYNISGYLASRKGSLLELFGKTVVDEAGHMRRAYDLGVQDTSAQHSIRERLTAVMMNASVPEGASLRERIASYFAIAGRGARELISTGLPVRAEDPIYPSIKPFGTFTSGTQHMLLGSTVATWRMFEEMTGRAVQWLQNPANTAARNDDSFRFNEDHAAALGYQNRFLGLLQDRKAFGTMLVLLNNYGLRLDQMAKDFMGRTGATQGASFLDDRAFARLLPVAPTELLQEANLGSRPSALLTNPALHVGLPLLGWAIAQSGGVTGSIHPRLGPGDWKDFGKGLYAFAALMGIGLAYGLLRDLYDEELLGKKANRLTVGRDNTFKAMVDRMDQVGAIGILGSAANSLVNGDSTARDFSIDSRVFAVSAMLNMRRAISDWYHQGWTATYATVGRPMLQSLGGSGYLQYAQIMNRVTGAAADGEHLPGFEQEARMTARINASNWLRVAGRGLNLEVRTGRGASDVVPNKMTPYVREMGLAALGNDASEFADAYRSAVLAAREEKAPDPQDTVKRAFESQHPLRAVFKTQLSEADVRRLLAALPEDGRQDVMEAVRLFNRFGSRMDIPDYWGKPVKESRGTSPLRSIADVLRSQARLPSVAGF